MDCWTALILGFLGSVHCAGMCAPLALALPRTGKTWAGFAGGRLAYNFGRITTYCLLGFLFGCFGKTFLLAGVQRWVSIGLGVALLAGLSTSWKSTFQPAPYRLVGFLKSRMSALLQKRSLVSLSLLGLLNGLLPCGLVYVACAGATSTGTIVKGMVYMGCFGLGTLPLMLGVGLSQRVLPSSFRLKLQKAIPISVILLATLLILRGMSLGIPYISPVLTGEGSSCCHN